MANLTRKWKRVMAVACSHGDLIAPQALRDVLDFKRRFKPDIRIHLGDLVDTACFRGGAAGTKDEARSPRDDMAAAESLLQRYEPNAICYGNHEWRLYELSNHPKAIIATLAGDLWNRIENQAKRLKAKTVPYDIKHGWLKFGGVAFCHGYMFSMNALKEHTHVAGGPVVMGHLHTPQFLHGRTIHESPSFCVGALADDENLTYGRRRAACLSHSHGVVFGEVCDDAARLWLASGPNGGKIAFPPGV